MINSKHVDEFSFMVDDLFARIELCMKKNFRIAMKKIEFCLTVENTEQLDFLFQRDFSEPSKGAKLKYFLDGNEQKINQF